MEVLEVSNQLAQDYSLKSSWTCKDRDKAQDYNKHSKTQKHKQTNKQNYGIHNITKDQFHYYDNDINITYILTKQL